jgi:single-stranded-DNA-specific exonuclease
LRVNAVTSGTGSAARLREPERRWVLRGAKYRDADVAGLAAALNLPAALCRLLLLRGYGDPAAARTFLKPRLDELHDPLLMADAARAVERIVRAIGDGERILVHGDYDVDGICAASLFTRVLRSLGAAVEPFVPHRLTDGYDLGQAGVRRAAETGAGLILTGDCGVVAHDAVAEARSQGIDVIITDHHTPGDVLPPAYAVLNPNRRDCAYPEKGLAGAGVAYKLCQALVGALGGDADALRWHLDLVALATIADLAPLAGENRVLAHYGLRVLRETRNPGLAALMRRAGVATGEPLTAGQVSHVLAPRLNAVGRMGAASRGVQLLLTDDDATAGSLADEMEAENRTRQNVDRAMLDEALEMLETSFDAERDFVVVLSREGWHPGVIGIVASRVVERVHRPVVLIAEDPQTGRGRGSARSIPPFHLFDGIHACAALLERYGGHRQAAGLELRLDRIDTFRDELNRHARAVLTPADLIAEVKVDLEVTLREADAALCRLMRHCGPFGIANPQPVFVATAARIERFAEVGDGQHAKMLLVQDGATLPAVAFRMVERVRPFAAQDVAVDVAFQLQQDTWNGRDRLQARIVDLRCSA